MMSQIQLATVLDSSFAMAAGVVAQVTVVIVVAAIASEIFRRTPAAARCLGLCFWRCCSARRWSRPSHRPVSPWRRFARNHSRPGSRPIRSRCKVPLWSHQSMLPKVHWIQSDNHGRTWRCRSNTESL